MPLQRPVVISALKLESEVESPMLLCIQIFVLIAYSYTLNLLVSNSFQIFLLVLITLIATTLLPVNKKVKNDF
jgi:hypothetical protein